MPLGWEILGRLDGLDPGSELDAAPIDQACDDLSKVNTDLQSRVVETLRGGGHGRYVAGVEGQFGHDPTLFNVYFANDANAAGIGVPSFHDRLDGPRAAVNFYMSASLQETLVAHLRAVPEATVLGARESPNPAEFAKVYRFTRLRQVVETAKTVQHEVEGFAGLVSDLLAPTGDMARPSYGCSRSWPHDASFAVSQILLGFLPASSPATMNAGVLTSAVVAASALRSHLEAVVFCIDFESSMRGLAPIVADDMDAALTIHEEAGTLSSAERMWGRVAYGLLSASLHGGRVLTYGEVWAMKRLVRLLSQRVVAGHPVTPLGIARSGPALAPEE